MQKPIITQDFNWHDVGTGGTYVFGEDGYLVMDGSRGAIKCSRRLSQPLAGTQDAVELKLRVVLGKRYQIRFYTADGVKVVDCEVDGNGAVRFAGNGRVVDSGLGLRFMCGVPYTDPTKRKWYVVESDEHLLRFEGFDFGTNTFRFVIDDEEPIVISNCLCSETKRVERIELCTCDMAVGSRIRLRKFVCRIDTRVVERETFPLYWKPISAPADGMPDDNVCDTIMRPVDYEWLETSTHYGYVKAGIPSMLKGVIEFDMKTTNVSSESCLVLEEYQGIIKGGIIQVGLLSGKMMLFTGGKVMNPDQPIEIANDYVYRIKIAWDLEAKTCRMWLENQPMSFDGKQLLPLLRLPHNGIDTIQLHPGDAGHRPTLIQKLQGKKQSETPPLLTCWGRFKVYSE
jgi:hypothetical protein